MKDIKISLAAARVNAKLTQLDVATKMHVSRQTVVNWENGKVIPKQAELEMMCRLYDFPVDNIFLPSR